MQTGIFYVKLKDNIDPSEQGDSLSGRIAYLHDSFKSGKPYPVLAVEYRETNKTKQTFYHLPTESNELEWFSSSYFLFARD
jgi:hypothetical protein